MRRKASEPTRLFASDAALKRIAVDSPLKTIHGWPIVSIDGLARQISGHWMATKDDLVYSKDGANLIPYRRLAENGEWRGVDD